MVEQRIGKGKKMSDYHTIGNKYEDTKKLNLKEIAKLVRNDIKVAKKQGKLPKEVKVSVRTEYYAGGQSLNLTIKNFPGGFMNPKFVKEMAENPHRYYGEYSPRYRQEVSDAIKLLYRTVGAYNFNNSDTMTDYFHVRFYSNVEVDYSATQREEEEIRASL